LSTESETELSEPAASSSRKRHAAPKRSRSKRRHRSQYPTPEFYYFALLLNIGALVVAALLLPNNPTNIPLLATGLLGGLGLILSLYSIAIRPKESNRKQRKILVAVTLSYGFVLLVIHAINILSNPTAFIT
jgi:peptidoglycan/LPS O-acetylase OafA/YrhL